MPKHAKSIPENGSASNIQNLGHLISEWERLQAEIEEIVRIEYLNSNQAIQSKNDERECLLQNAQNEILDKIIKFPCHSIHNVREKIGFWQRVKLLGSRDFGMFSLADQIALSIDLSDR